MATYLYWQLQVTHYHMVSPFAPLFLKKYSQILWICLYTIWCIVYNIKKFRRFFFRDRMRQIGVVWLLFLMAANKLNVVLVVFYYANYTLTSNHVFISLSTSRSLGNKKQTLNRRFAVQLSFVYVWIPPNDQNNFLNKKFNKKPKASCFV